MNTYLVRPYYGFDCDSENGFNDGYYFAPVSVQAKDEIHAALKARALWLKENPIKNAKKVIEDSNTFGLDIGLYWEFEHSWRDDEGNEYDKEPSDKECDIFYLYKYIDFCAGIQLID